MALDQAYQKRQDDTEGKFYRKITDQGPRKSFKGTTQGIYVAGPDGLILGYSNNREPRRIKQMMAAALDKFVPGEVSPLDPGPPDVVYRPDPPQGGLIVRVQAKILGGYDQEIDGASRNFQSSVSRDNLWITKSEHEALVRGEFPETLQLRMARFHLVDNTRGEPPMWKVNEIRNMEIRWQEGELEGSMHLETESGERGYQCQLSGSVEVNAGQVSQFELYFKGDFWGEGRFTRHAPEGRFPLAVLFTLADGTDIADRIPPQGSRSWVEGYLLSR